MRARVATAILLALALAAVSVTAAGARVHSTYFPTTFHVEYAAEPGGGVFVGELISIKRTCNPRRKIVITALGPDGREVVGRGTSNSQGGFEFPARAVPRGDLEAEVEEKRIPPRTRYVNRICLRGKAEVLVP